MIQLASPDIQETDIARVNEVLKSGNLVQGEFVEAFEKKLVEFSKIDNCALVTSGTSALHLSLLALGIKAGDWVIVPAFTFPATANVVEIIGANVILCDVDPTQYVVQPEEIEKVILKNSDKAIKAIIVVHEFGFPAQIKAIADIAKKHNIFLVEDSACALGTIADGYHTGFYSDLACFSFHPRKAITTGEGGAILSGNSLLVEKIRCFRNHGIIKTQTGIDFIYAGFNYRMTEIQAALGLGQLERFENEIRKRKEIAGIYHDQLSGIKYLKEPFNNVGHSWQSYMIVLQENINRNRIIQQLLENGIQSNYGAQALNSLMFFKNKYGFIDSDYSQSTRLYNSGLALPIYGKLELSEIIFITQTLKLILGKYHA